MKKILILGVNGFIGHHLSQRILASTDWSVYGMDMASERVEDLMDNPRFKFFEGDITINREWIEYHIRKCDVILPLVAIATPATYVKEPLKVFELDFERDGEVHTVRPPHRIAANDADTWVAAAVAGLGLIQTPCSGNVRAHCERGELVRVLPDWRVAGLPISVLWPRDKHVVARVRAFVDWVSVLYADEFRLAAAAELATRRATPPR